MLKKNLTKIIFFIFIITLIKPENSYAYFDPGTGSYIVQLLLAFLASCYVFISNPIKFLKEYFKKNKKIDDTDQNSNEDKKK